MIKTLVKNACQQTLSIVEGMNESALAKLENEHLSECTSGHDDK